MMRTAAQICWTGFIRSVVIKKMYYLGKNGQQTGPYTVEQLQAMVVSGQVAPLDLRWTEGMSEWKPAGAVLPGIFPTQGSGPGIPPPLSSTQGPITAVPGAEIPNYLWQSIAVTLCCCLPFGIAAIVYAAQVNSKLGLGDTVGAQNSSKKAKMWCWIAFGVGIPLNIIVFAIQFYAFFQQAMRH